jgi:hypothetical protein
MGDSLDLRADDEEEEKADDDEDGDEPADPVVPGTPPAVFTAISVDPTPSSHWISVERLGWRSLTVAAGDEKEARKT